MGAGVPTRLNADLGRRFGLQVGAVFLLLAAVSAWRDHDLAPKILAGLGGVLVAGGAVAPKVLLPVYRAWMGLALLLSKVTTPILMGAIFFLVLTPTGLALRLVRRPGPDSGSRWFRRLEGQTRSDLARQF